jgi:hypothetical protein
MYIRHHVTIDQPAREVRRELLGPPERWLGASVTSPLGERRYLVRVGFRAPLGHIEKEVELTVGAPEAPGDWLVVPIAWRATGRPGLFPVLDGKLTVQPLGTRSSTMWIGATYQPPLGAVGQELDDVALHNVARATIEEFVAGVATRLSELAANRPG